ncbi:MAG TPA: DUF4249 domain-containing protein [Chryseosolibacter sp.]|nr:DUF4249 domain-containing protein [Chryseosolibacter sp.]
MKRYPKIFTRQRWFAVVLVIAMAGCVDVIEFPVRYQAGQLIVYGQFNDQAEQHFVRLSTSVSKYRPPQPVSGAQVILMDDNGNQYAYQQSEAGVYVLEESISGSVGSEYFIEIRLQDQVYRSTPEKIPAPLGTDSAFYEISQEAFPSVKYDFLTRHLNIFTKSALPVTTEDYYLRWEVHELYFWELTDFPDPFGIPAPECFVYDLINPERINLLDGRTVNPAVITQFLAAREIDPSFKNRHYIIVRQASLTRGSFEYWNKILTTITNTGSVFDIPPAAVPGNIYNINNPDERVLGYFEASRVSVNRFFLVGGWIPHRIPQYCEYDPNKWWGYPDECLNCQQPNTRRPPWF